jgi:membrane-associated protein
VTGVASTLLAWLLDYTYPVAMLAVLTGAIGVPLPTTIVVLAAGAISADGDADPFVMFGAILVAAVAGDLTSYTLARWAEGLALQRLGGQVGLTPTRLEAVERRFERWGGLLVLVTRCLLTGLALPTNLVAAGSGYSIRRFLVFAILGEAIWAAELLWLGWLYGSNWVALVDYLDDASAALTGLAVAAVLAFVLFRMLRTKPA